ncbi:hypothetical protein FN846DRAFT_896056 [Sphaerosporella brunnea]|uniref:Uncharacterized protein n=1 Tax=Sphaerosporella brunnea TaxID=1250544 RepID=A0A5J5EF49_9PEZI|nr:hypothetical protein FN846DRAFT_896056 [Sphaerosporella brunnea]
MSEHQPAAGPDIPFEFRAEHPANPFHTINTTEAKYGPDAANEKPGATSEELQRLVWVRTSDWTDTGRWEAHTPSEIPKLEEEQRVKQLKRQQSTQAVPKKKKKKVNRVKVVNHKIYNESFQVNEDLNLNTSNPVHLDPLANVSTSNLSMTEVMHPDRINKIKKHIQRSGFKGKIQPHILEYIQTPYVHTIPEFIRNLKPVVDRPRRSGSGSVPNLPYPYPWLDIPLSAKRDDSVGKLTTTTFQLRGREKVFNGFFDISKEQAQFRELARQAGHVS